MDNYLITGIPRSGTSLLISLCQSDKTICFSEPKWLKSLKDKSNDCDSLTDNLLAKIKDLRSDISNNIAIELIYDSKGKALPANYFHSKINRVKLSKNRQSREFIFPKEATSFPMYIKANALFMAAIENLTSNLDLNVCVIVRDPLAVIKSWNSVAIASSKGRVKTVEKFSTQLKEIGSNKNLLDRQIQLVDWYFKKASVVNRKNLIFYESFVKNPGIYLEENLNIKLKKPISLENKNNNPIYNNNMDEVIRKKLTYETTYVSKFYPNYCVK